MPVWPVENARAGVQTHIGDNWFATRCRECDELLKAQFSWALTRVMQDHLYSEHEITAALLP